MPRPERERGDDRYEPGARSKAAAQGREDESPALGGKVGTIGTSSEPTARLRYGDERMRAPSWEGKGDNRHKPGAHRKPAARGEEDESPALGGKGETTATSCELRVRLRYKDKRRRAPPGLGRVTTSCEL